ncbi:MAG: hypothetical protein QOJ50_2115 [Cryptosporangiaceae bacterium]|nr:hypothetical protein [Cryptosporangiaceae bacterium]
MRCSHLSDASLGGLMLSVARHVVPAQEASGLLGVPASREISGGFGLRAAIPAESPSYGRGAG